MSKINKRIKALRKVRRQVDALNDQLLAIREMEEAFFDDDIGVFRFLWRTYALWPDDRLTEDGRKVKRTLLNIVEAPL